MMMMMMRVLQKSGLRHLLTRVVVHIADSNVIKTTESPDYDIIRLVSDIGGQLGLWIGVSVITLVEVLQLAALIVRVITARRRRRLRPSSKSRSPPTRFLIYTLSAVVFTGLSWELDFNPHTHPIPTEKIPWKSPQYLHTHRTGEPIHIKRKAARF